MANGPERPMANRANPIRVLHVIDSLQSGGKERQLVELLKGLSAETDVSCKVVVMSDLVQYDDLDGLRIKTHILPRISRYDLSMFSRLRCVLRDFGPDIVHSWNAMCSVYGAPLAKLSGAKFVNGFVRAAIPGLTFRDPDYFRGKLTLPLSDVVVANSAAGLAAYNIPEKRGVCIHNGFDQARIAQLEPLEETRRSLGIATKYIVGMVGSFSVFKDYDSFFDMARRVIALRSDVTFVAIGGGENLDSFRRAFPEESHPQIKLVGYRSDVESIVNIFTVGVLLSTQGEGCSNSIMEYMALGKPVVATDCGGNSELIEDGICGYLIGNRDVGALTDRVLKLLDDPALAAAMGEHGRRRIREEFSLEKMTQAYTRLYRELLTGRRDWSTL